MKKISWISIAIVVLPLFGAGLFAFTDLKSDVRLVESALAAGEENYKSLDAKVEAIQTDLRQQGTNQAVTASQVRDIRAQLEKLEKNSSESSAVQAALLRRILQELGQ